MKKPNSGWSFHCHHDILIAWCSDYKGRVKHIEEKKPKNERALRLKLFRLIPPKQMEKIFGQKAYAEWEKAYAERQKADAEWRKADAEWRKALEKNFPAIRSLHEKLCGCNWGDELTGNIFGGAID